MKIPSLLCLFLVAATFAARGEGYADGGVKFTGEPPAPGGAVEFVVSPTCRRLDRGAADWQRASGRDGFWPRESGTVATERGHALGRRPLRSKQYERDGGTAGSTAADQRGQVQRGGPAGKLKMIAKPRGQMPYEPVGDLLLDFPEAQTVADYRRDLNLDTAIGSVEYTINGVNIRAKCSRVRWTRSSSSTSLRASPAKYLLLPACTRHKKRRSQRRNRHTRDERRERRRGRHRRRTRNSSAGFW